MELHAECEEMHQLESIKYPDDSFMIQYAVEFCFHQRYFDVPFPFSSPVENQLIYEKNQRSLENEAILTIAKALDQLQLHNSTPASRVAVPQFTGSSTQQIAHQTGAGGLGDKKIPSQTGAPTQANTAGGLSNKKIPSQTGAPTQANTAGGLSNKKIPSQTGASTQANTAGGLSNKKIPSQTGTASSTKAIDTSEEGQRKIIQAMSQRSWADILQQKAAMKQLGTNLGHLPATPKAGATTSTNSPAQAKAAVASTEKIAQGVDNYSHPEVRIPALPLGPDGRIQYSVVGPILDFDHWYKGDRYLNRQTKEWSKSRIENRLNLEIRIGNLTDNDCIIWAEPRGSKIEPRWTWNQAHHGKYLPMLHKFLGDFMAAREPPKNNGRESRPDIWEYFLKWEKDQNDPKTATARVSNEPASTANAKDQQLNCWVGKSPVIFDKIKKPVEPQELILYAKKRREALEKAQKDPTFSEVKTPATIKKEKLEDVRMATMRLRYNTEVEKFNCQEEMHDLVGKERERDFVSIITTMTDILDDNLKKVKIFMQLPDAMKYLNHDHPESSIHPDFPVWDGFSECFRKKEDIPLSKTAEEW
ncbi:hypothetical protein EAE99_009458 [Botrytis elliptica]|nr:hypothetical protein EAE99_009458 [Botrytis elliptica]